MNAAPYNFATLSVEEAKNALAVTEAAHKLAGEEAQRLREAHKMLALAAEDADKQRREADARVAALRLEGIRLAHVAVFGKCRQEMRGGDTWHPTYSLCTKPAKNGFYCGIHMASRKRSRLPVDGGQK